MPKGKIGGSSRRTFLKSAATATVALPALAAAKVPAHAAFAESSVAAKSTLGAGTISFPRAFSGEYLSRISFPLGGIGTGCIGLGGRGNLQDWEIFNKSQLGNNPHFAFPAIWVESGGGQPFSAILERCLLPPFDTTDNGLGYYNMYGIPRLREATFHGSFPLARVEFQDSDCPVHAALEAFSPFQPLDADASGLPCAVLAYEVHNPGQQPAEVVIAWSIENPIGFSKGRANQARDASGVAGVLMTDPSLVTDDPLNGSFVLAALPGESAQTERLVYWGKDEWYAREQHFWFDEFSPSGKLGKESEAKSSMAAVALRQTIPSGEKRQFRFLLTWHFPNRTPAWIGWTAPKGDENAKIGNYYCTRFENAWAVAEYAATNLKDLESRTRSFVKAIGESSLPDVVKDAATSNLCTLASNTGFRIANGSFHGFEGCGDTGGLGHGTCTHVWNYEVASQCVFPSLSRSMRETSFGPALDANGKMDFRHTLPAGNEHSDSATDGQMGQIIKLYFDWRLCGDNDWLRKQWPGAKLAMQYAWRPGSWDADKNGVMEGVQHNTYDVEFYGPNPICGTWYLAALKAAAIMAAAMADDDMREQCDDLYQRGSAWVDANLFNGEFYIQKIQKIDAKDVAPDLLPDEDSRDALTHVKFQLGDGCHIDQLVGQYMASVAGLGDLLDSNHVRKTLQSILRYNAKPNLYRHASAQRAFALNDEPAVIICDYSKGGRPDITAPYWSEIWTGLEYELAALLITHGMAEDGVKVIENIRIRHDGKRRNPYAESEYGRHYARPMSSWASVPLLAGFHYDAVDKRLAVEPPLHANQPFSFFWSVPSGWGTVKRSVKGPSTQVSLQPVVGNIVVQQLTLPWPGNRPASVSAALAGSKKNLTPTKKENGITLRFDEPWTVTADSSLEISS